ncbi:I78 family peptidase inhibitor [uncultured Lentibacter sp.]|uniref:I78 family peptidase inhibitor n=1 Tax=uncultured Lentibacter sp. TaxID=1659309 RepID=UPI002630A099|nr:I78 family peptidase inhibitor [uncultured Lentibacter sp.]
MYPVRFSASIAVIALISACQMAPTNAPAPAYPPATHPTKAGCGAEDVTFMTGMRIGDVKFDTSAGPVRIVGPNSAITKDHRPARLNVLIDASERITGFRCG